MTWLMMLALPFGVMGFYYWRREMWLGIIAAICWLTAAIVFQSQSSGATPLDFADFWMVLFWICMMFAIGFTFVVFRWRDQTGEWVEDEDESTGEPIMVMMKKGMRTERTRDLTDVERMNRRKRIQTEHEEKERSRRDTRVSSKPSFGETGKIG